ncbi:MAG TPA: CoA pyrophosphatase [Acidimicrobiia bacterium]|nr:CoA pyrophosphatase [Acidimicrobiia bacterium]
MTTTRGGRQHIPRPPGTRPGRPAPWAGLDPTARHLGLADVRARLADLAADRETSVIVEGSPDNQVPSGARPAAVLLPLFEEHGEARVVLTKRPDTMPSHRGEIAFPGGKLEPTVDADLRAAALREAHEEIGLDPATVDVVARLDGIATVASQFVITPFVGMLAGRPALTPDPREVVRVFDVALSDLLADGVYREERWDTWRMDLDVHFYELVGETVWGATARILTGFLTHLLVPGRPRAG